MSLASVSVHESTIRKKLEKNEIHGRAPRQKQLGRKMKACLRFAKKHHGENFLASTHTVGFIKTSLLFMTERNNIMTYI